MSDERVHPIVQFKRDMEQMVAKELDMLAADDRSKMKSAAIVAVTKDPDLLLADRQSFMAAIRMCAQHGVIPDGNEAVLQVYNTKAKDRDGKEIWIKKVTYLPMIRGIVTRVLRSGQVKLFWAEVVYSHEPFKIDASHGDRRPVHDYDPMRRGADKDIIGAYAVAVYQDGTTDVEAMPRAEIEKVRNAAKTKNVWDGWLSEKSKVAVMKRMSKRLPMSAKDLEFIQNREETDFDVMRDVTPARKDGFAELAMRGRTAIAAPEPEGHWTDNYNQESGFPGSEAWDQGIAASQAQAEAKSCPYAEGSQDAADWLGGFHGHRSAQE